MVWLIILAVIVVLVVVLWTNKRLKVLKEKERLEQTLQSVVASYRDLKAKIQASDIRENEKTGLIANIDQSIVTLERWESTALPNVTFFKNHTEPIEKEFAGLQESVARELAKYEDLSGAKG